MKLMPFVRRFVPRTATMVEEPGYHLEPDHVICPHCEQIYCTEGLDDIALELDCCPAEKCKLRAIGERARAAEELGVLAARWRRAEPVLQSVAHLEPTSDELIQLVMLSNLRISARRILGWCELCQARQAEPGRKACAECRAILRGAADAEEFNG